MRFYILNTFMLELRHIHNTYALIAFYEHQLDQQVKKLFKRKIYDMNKILLIITCPSYYCYEQILWKLNIIFCIDVLIFPR